MPKRQYEGKPCEESLVHMQIVAIGWDMLSRAAMLIRCSRWSALWRHHWSEVSPKKGRHLCQWNRVAPLPIEEGGF